MSHISYFCRYILGFAEKTACIASLTKNGVDFSWAMEHQNAHKEIVECLTSEPVLVIYDPSLPIEVPTIPSVMERFYCRFMVVVISEWLLTSAN